jgi:hypothetical protein
MWMLLLTFSLPESAPEWMSGLLAGGTLVAIVLGWFYRQEIKKVKELRERLGESEPNSFYRNLTNEQLKNKTLTHVEKIRNFIYHKEVKQIQANTMMLAKENDEEGQPITEEQKEYRDNGFHIETLRLRDELWIRLPINCRAGKLCSREGSCNLFYKRPLKLNHMQIISNDLERLAHNLKT